MPENKAEDDLEKLEEPGQSISPPQEQQIPVLPTDNNEQPQEDDAKESKESPDELKEDTEKQKQPLSRKKLIIIIIVIITLIIALLLVIVFVKLNSDEEPDKSTKKITKKIKQKIQPEIKPDQIDKLLKKANYLYKHGKAKEALDIFDKISSFSDSVSMYNLGVSQMKQKDFKKALESFKKSIKNESNRCVSAINAGVCALYLDDKKLFNYYIDLASSYLHTTANSKMYSYYYALINYYKNQYIESLSALKDVDLKSYRFIKNHLASNMYIALDDNKYAIDMLERDTRPIDYKTLGLLYARVGEYNSGIKYLLKADNQTSNSIEIKLALGLSYLKIGRMQAAYKYIKDAHSIDNNKAASTYPIKVVLKESLFNINNAQSSFIKDMNIDYKGMADLFFYFAPYKLTNLNKTISYIRKGNKNSYIDQIQNAQIVYKKGSFIASINKKMSKGIKKSLEFKIRDANAIFANLIKTYPNYSYLQYNLALSYAQLGLYNKAYMHFKKSYNLDTNNYLSAIFMYLSAKLSNFKTRELGDQISKDFNNTLDENKPQDAFYNALYEYVYANNIVNASSWLQDSQNTNKTSLMRVFEIIIASQIDRDDIQKNKAQKLLEITNNDVVANILNFYAQHKHYNKKEFAMAAQKFLRENRLNAPSLYYGPKSVKEIYIKLAQVAGMLYDVRDMLRERVLTERYDTRGVLQALAYTDIYLNFFEEGYTIYNKLIDEFKEDDSYTLFLGAVCAIGANHHGQAIILLELANLADKLNYESRYALGLLYHEVPNLEAAQIQYSKINLKDFESKYFDFRLIRKPRKAKN